MDHENIYLMMMDALDGELAEDQQIDLEAHLRACPPCSQEWQTIMAIDTLFRQTPSLSPMAGFTQRTLARLPNRKYRVWTLSAMYFMLLMAGTLPLFIGFWAVSRLGPILREPTLVQSILQSMDKALQIVGTVLLALLSGAGEFLLQNPSVFGWLLVMAGIVSLWGGVYRQVLTPQRQTQLSNL